MKHWFLSLLLAVSSTAMADCYMRSAINLKLANTGPVDMQRMVTKDSGRYKCVSRYRIHIGQDWQTAEGVGYGSTETAACDQAIDTHRGYLLLEMAPSQISANNQMVCSDIPEIRVHPVRIGDIIFESETDLHTIPAERKYFWYKRSRCRMFVERDIKNQNMTVNQGIICALNDSSNSKWQVVDKY
jgi:hypothetical protein